MSKRVTKTLAEEVARKLCEKFNTGIASKKKELEALVTQEAWRRIPDEVTKLFKKDPSFIMSRSQVTLDNDGDMKWQRISFTSPIPYSKSETKFALPPKLLKEATKLYKEITTLKRDKKKVNAEIIQAIVALRTYKRVENDFPEAFKFFPKESESLLPSVNLQNLRDKVR